jgi:tRNA A-37 threonylcarbamoyl transferase component Bud32
MCGAVPEGMIAIAATRAEAVDDLARVELAERFRFDEFLGRGATSAVYLAREQGSTRQIVVKVMPRPAERRALTDERFRIAVESVAALEHPHIVPVFEHGCSDHLYWYSMEHVRGRSLRDFLLQRGTMDLKACLRVVAQVASALDHAHRRGIVHGALWPANVLIDADGWVHVSDLAVRRALESVPPPPPPPPPLLLPVPSPAAEVAPVARAEDADASVPEDAAVAPPGGGERSPPESVEVLAPEGAVVAPAPGPVVSTRRESLPQVLLGRGRMVLEACRRALARLRSTIQGAGTGVMERVRAGSVYEGLVRRGGHVAGACRRTVARGWSAIGRAGRLVMESAREGSLGDLTIQAGRRVLEAGRLAIARLASAVARGFRSLVEHVRGGSLRGVVIRLGEVALTALRRVAALLARAIDHARRPPPSEPDFLKPEAAAADDGESEPVGGLVSVRPPEVLAAGPDVAWGPDEAGPAGELEPAVEPDRGSGQTAGEERSPYDAPEGLWTPASDQYALAVLVTECLTGSPLRDPGDFDVASAATIAAARANVPFHVVVAVRRAASPKPIDRFASVLDFVAALESPTGPVPEARSASRSSGMVLRQTDYRRARPGQDRRRVVGGALAIAAVAIVLAWKGPAVVRTVRRMVTPPKVVPIASFTTDTAAPGAGPATSPPVAVPGRGSQPAAPPAAPPPAPATPAPATPTRAPVVAPGTARLFVNSMPWGQLYVDGQLVGNTPRANLPLAAGTHTIQVVREGFAPYADTVHVLAGQVVRITDIVLVAQPQP